MWIYLYVHVCVAAFSLYVVYNFLCMLYINSKDLLSYISEDTEFQFSLVGNTSPYLRLLMLSTNNEHIKCVDMK